MAFRSFAVALCAATALSGAASAQVQGRPSLAEPALSPDGREIAFVSGGDVWTVPAEGGTARLLVTDAANESRPLWSPDGTRLAFTSDRGGFANVYVLDLATGAVKRLTWSDAGERLDGWSRDGKWLYLTSFATDVGRTGDLLRVSAEGGTPLEVSRDRFLNEFHAAPTPDGTAVAFAAKGIGANQWWRNGRSHIDESELWLKPLAEGAPYRRLLPGGAKKLWPQWSADGGTLFYMSDEGGTENLWSLSTAPGAAPRRLTSFKSGRLLWPSVGGGDRIVFERDFGVWSWDPGTGEARPVPITLRGAPAATGPRRLNETEFSAFALAPDGKKIAVVARGEVFAASATDGGAAQRISRTPAAESQPVWSPDSKTVVYVSERGLDSQLVQYDFATQKETVLTSGAGVLVAPVFSPDGKQVAYVREPRELRVLTLPSAGKPAADRLVYRGQVAISGFGGEPAWSPDGRWIAFGVVDSKSFTGVHVVPAAGGEARQVSFLADGDAASRIAWAPDGRYLIFNSAQRAEDAKLIRVDLLPNVPRFREDAFRELFGPATQPGQPAPADKPAAPASAERSKEANEKALADKAEPAGKLVRIVFEGIGQRATVLPIGLDARDPVISPDGKTLVFAARVGAQENLYSYSLDELAREAPTPQALTTGARSKGEYVFTADSKTLFYREGGQVYSTPLDGPRGKLVSVSAEMEADFDAEKQVVFDQAWGLLNRRFYDPGFHGRDWNAVRAAFAPQIAGAKTADEMRRLLNLMVGELNASHTGVNRPFSGPGSSPSPRVGDLGLRFEREAYETGGVLRVREVIALGPAALEGTIKVGETLLSVDGEAVGPGVNLDRLLNGKIGRRTVLRVADASGKAREAVVRPVSSTVAGGLAYRQWVDERRAYVNRISGGELGYVHVADMGDASLAQLYLDLDAENHGKAGVVVDIRNNNGGYVNGRVLDVLTRQNFITMTVRDFAPAPSRPFLGQRALGLPTVLVTNESSLSDAELFTESYRAANLGKVVGTPTSGWIIYTSNVPLLDGSVVRVPFIRIEDLSGRNMELNPRPVDVRVERPLGETVRGADVQLDAAVRELLARVGP